MRLIIGILIVILAHFDCSGQAFINGDLEGPPIMGFTTVAPGWQAVSSTDPNCMAIFGDFATPDLTSMIAPSPGGGVIGNPYSGLTFMSGIRADTENHGQFHEGILQTLHGLEVNGIYKVGFMQAVVKQFNCLDQSGSWSVYLDNNLLAVVQPTFSSAPFNSTSFIWEERSVIFTATSPSHTLKFLPEDDDLELMVSLNSINGGLRMGIDSIYLSVVPPCVVKVNIGNDTTICQGQSVIVSAGTIGDTYLWNTGQTTPAITVSLSNTYTVTVINNDCVSRDTIKVQVIPLPFINLGSDTSLCFGNSLELQATTTNASYLWHNNTTNSSFTVTQQGTYWVTVTSIGCTASDTIQVLFNPVPVFTLGNDTSLCRTESLLLNPNVVADNFQWQDGSTIATYSAIQSGNYWVTAQLNNCTYSDSISVLFQELPIVELGNDTTLCNEESMLIGLNLTNAGYLWQDGSSSSTFTAIKSGNYWVEVTQNGCTARDEITLEFIDCTTELVMPNIFSPNQDAVNDTFRPILFKNILTMKTVIYNRWGKKVFETDQLPIEWNGQINSSDLAPDGLYYYYIEYLPLRGEQLSKKGWANLIR